MTLEQIKAEIRKQTPLSVTSSLESPIYKVLEKIRVKVYTSMEIDGRKETWWTLRWVTLFPEDLLRLLQCDDDERDNVYRIGDGNDFVKIPDDKMAYVWGNIGRNVTNLREAKEFALTKAIKGAEPEDIHMFYDRRDQDNLSPNIVSGLDDDTIDLETFESEYLPQSL